jgi:hypothetical protein
MQNKTTKLVCAALLLAAALGAPAATISGQRFDDRIRLAGADLQLNGLGLRAEVWLEGYAAGLYLPKRASTPAEVLADEGPKRMQLKMMLDVPAKEFNKAIEKGVRRNSTPVEQEAVRDRIAQFEAGITAVGQVRKGDVIDIDYLPARGLVLSINGTPRGEPIPGADLYAAVLRIFLGERPVDRELKSGLLGGPSR